MASFKLQVECLPGVGYPQALLNVVPEALLKQIKGTLRQNENEQDHNRIMQVVLA